MSLPYRHIFFFLLEQLFINIYYFVLIHYFGLIMIDKNCSGVTEVFFFFFSRLYDCNIGEKDCAALISALRSNPSHLVTLNLNYNELGESGVKLLSTLLKDPQCKLEKLKSVFIISFSYFCRIRQMYLHIQKCGDKDCSFCVLFV